MMSTNSSPATTTTTTSSSSSSSVCFFVFLCIFVVVSFRYKWTAQTERHWTVTANSTSRHHRDRSRDYQLSSARHDDSSTKPLCSFRTFRDYLRRMGAEYLPGDGVWSRRRGPTTARDAAGGQRVRPPPSTFRPSICRLDYGAWFPRQQLVTCLRRLNVTYVVILGDSNAWRFFHAVRRSLAQGGHNRQFICEPLASNVNTSPPRAFDGGAYLPQRRCSLVYLHIHFHLPPNYFRCLSADSDVTLLVQYLPVTGDLLATESNVNTLSTGCWERDGPGSGFTSTRASTLQEFLLREYFAVDPQPDLILYLSSTHEQLSLQKYNDSVQGLASLLQLYTPRRTRVVVVSKPEECIRLKPDNWKFVRYESNELNRSQWVDAANHILHSHIAPVFARDGRPLLFPDIAATMRSVVDELAVDGVHSSQFWYKTLWSYIMQALCND